MNQAPQRPGIGAYLIATATGASCACLVTLRVATYLLGMPLGRELNLITFVSAVITGVVAMALFADIGQQRQKMDRAEELRHARWTGYGQCARDIFDPPLDTGDTIDLLRR